MTDAGKVICISLLMHVKNKTKKKTKIKVLYMFSRLKEAFIGMIYSSCKSKSWNNVYCPSLSTSIWNGFSV